MEYKDYYKIMGLKRDVAQDEIKRTYRKLARKYHPDLNKEADSEAKFKELGEAYEVLGDPEKRAAYDHLDPKSASTGGFQPPPNWDSGYEYSGGESDGAAGFSDFFEELFGRRGASRGAGAGGQFHSPGGDHHAKVTIDLEDAYRGANRSFVLQSPSLDAQGRLHTASRTLNVKIPKGIREGQQIRLAGQGAPGIGEGRKGDLYLEIRFNPHPIYLAEGADLHMQLPVTPWEVALGATVKVPTPAGVIDLKVPAGSNSDKKMRIKGRGIPGNPAGDIYVVLKVVVPAATTDKDKHLYQEMAAQMAFNPRSKLGV